MKKIDHVRKMVYIIVGILTIISLVFTLYKKISHASEKPFPFYFGGGQHVPFYCTYEFGKSIYDDAVSRHGGDPYVVYNPTSGNVTVIFCEVLSYYESNGYYGILYSNIYRFMRYSLNSNGSFTLREDVSQNVVYWGTAAIGDLSDSTVYENYPFYCSRSSYFYNGDLFLALKLNSFNAHTKGGVLTNYDDSIGDIDNDPNLPKVDTTPPSDPSSNSGWFQKILNGIGRLNQSVQGGVLTIGDYIGAGIEKLEEKLSQVKDSITGLYNWFTEDFDINQFQNGINSIPLISDLNGLKSLVENSGMFDWSDVTAAQSVSFSFDFGGAVLPHSTNTIDFSWYTGNVKTICNAILCTFLVLGLFVTVVNQIPSIIGGHSGDKGGGSDS